MIKRLEIARNLLKQKINQKPEINQKSENTMKTKAKKIDITMVDPLKSLGLEMIKKKKNKNKTLNSFSCPECGSESNENQKFCKNCGKQFSENNTPMNQKELKKYTKKRLGGTFGPSKEVKKFFTTGSVFNRQKATTFAIITSDMVKEGIKSGEIKTFKDIDNVIEHRVAKIEEEKQKLLKLESEPKYTVVHDPGPIVQTYTKKPIDWSGAKRSSNIIGGAVLLGPAGALMGAAISDNKKPEPKTKTKVVHKTYTQKECNVLIHENKLRFVNRKNRSFVFFKYINSMVLLKDYNKFEIKQNDGAKITFYGETPDKIEYTENIYNKLESKFKDYQSKNKPKTVPKPDEIVSGIEEDPINQIKKLNELKEAGIITNDEFETKKKELLERI
jgi:uncharacterized OB-fold protein